MDTININKPISVISVAYRNKETSYMILNAIENSDNKDNINFYIGVQDSNHTRISRDIKNVHRVFYDWDSIDGFCKIKNNLIEMSRPDSTLVFVNSSTRFIKGWDTKINSFLSDKTVITKDENVIDTDCFIIKKSDLKHIGYPSFLKFYGENEDLSIRLYCNDFHIKGSINEILIPGEKEIYDYLHFSKTHKFYEVENLYKNGFNSYFDIRNCQKKFNDYAEQYPLKKIHYQYDDVSYDVKHLPKLSWKRFRDGKKGFGDAV